MTSHRKTSTTSAVKSNDNAPHWPAAVKRASIMERESTPLAQLRSSRTVRICHSCGYEPQDECGGICPKCGGNSWEQDVILMRLLPESA